MKRLALVLLSGCLLAGCSATEVDVTLNLASSIDLAAIRRMHLWVGTDETYSTDLPLVLPLTSRQQRFIYRSSISGGMLSMGVRAYDDTNVIGCGESYVTIAGGKATPFSLDLDPGECPDDIFGDMGGVSDGGADLAVADLAGADLAGPDLAGVDMAGPTPIFSDSFETGTLAKWMQFLGAPGMATVDQQHPHNGSWAVHLSTGLSDATYPSGEIYKQISSVTNPKLYIRAWYYIPQTTLNQTSTFEVMRWYDSGYSNGIAVQDDNNGLVDAREILGPSSSTSIAWNADGWTCVEIAIDTAKMQADLWVGKEADQLAPDFHLPWTDSLTLTALNFGVDGNLPLELWLDDVYVAASRVGCSTPTP